MLMKSQWNNHPVSIGSIGCKRFSMIRKVHEPFLETLLILTAVVNNSCCIFFLGKINVEGIFFHLYQLVKKPILFWSFPADMFLGSWTVEAPFHHCCGYFFLEILEELMENYLFSRTYWTAKIHQTRPADFNKMLKLCFRCSTSAYSNDAFLINFAELQKKHFLHCVWEFFFHLRREDSNTYEARFPVYLFWRLRNCILMVFVAFLIENLVSWWASMPFPRDSRTIPHYLFFENETSASAKWG